MKENKIRAKSCFCYEIAFFVALCMFLSAIEVAIPKPLPFMRLGLANLPIILALPIVNARQYFFISIMKIFVQTLVSGTLFSYVAVFSFTGSISSSTAMFLLWQIAKKTCLISFLGISITGALFNNIAQLLMSVLFLFKENTRYIAFLLLLSGFITGVLLGFFAIYFANNSQWYKKIIEENTSIL